MKNFYQQKLIEVWNHAVNLYERGHRDATTFPVDNYLPFLSEMGMNRIDVFDFAEDWVCEGEPDIATFLLIHEQRRDYFWEVQNRKPSSLVLDSKKLPAKDAEVNGIHWLPRIIPKAKAKLKGELPEETMFCCGGDRNFFHKHKIHPSEFLFAVRRAGDEDQKIIDWMVKRGEIIY